MKKVIEQAIEALNSTDSERGSEAWEREKEAMIALEKLAEQPAPVQGWKLVPLQPTDQMRDAGNVIIGDRGALFAAYDAMLAASPQAQPARDFVWLTLEEIKELKNLPGANRERTATEMAFAVRNKLMEKNT